MSTRQNYKMNYFKNLEMEGDFPYNSNKKLQKNYLKPGKWKIDEKIHVEETEAQSGCDVSFEET